MTADAARQLSAPGGQRDEKGAAIRFPDFARDQAALGEPIENAGQCGSLVGKAAVEIGHVCGRAVGKERENMRFSLGQAGQSGFKSGSTQEVRRAH